MRNYEFLRIGPNPAKDDLFVKPGLLFIKEMINVKVKDLMRLPHKADN